MGYCVSMSCSGLVIPAAKVEKANKAVVEDKMGDSLEDGADQAGHEYMVLENGDVEIGEFLGEKWRSQGEFYDAIAPFVNKGGYIECLGEDGERWKFEFNGKKAIEYSAETTWKKTGV